MNNDLVETVMGNLAGLYEQMNGNEIDTKAVKTALCKACRKIKNVCPFATGVEVKFIDGGEWLYDVTGLLYDNPDDENYFSRTVLVAESEWGRQLEILNDFQKLLLARADVRVMVFDGTQNPGYEKLFEIFKTNIDNNQQAEPGDIWLFAAWTPENWIFHHVD